jgi:hypothetical protein
MTDRIRRMLEHVLEKRHAGLRRDVDWAPLAAGFARASVSPKRRAAEGLCAMLAAERPAFLPEERLAFTRTVRQVPELYTRGEMDALRAGAYYHEKGCGFNISPDYATTIRAGLDARLAEMRARLARADAEQDAAAREFLACAIRSAEAVLDLVESSGHDG